MKTPDVQSIIEKAIEHADRMRFRRASNRLSEITSAPHYCESGYSTAKPVILFGNWNNPVERKTNYDVRPVCHTYKSPADEKEAEFFTRLVKALESLAECEWSDEWATCSHCQGAVRTNADSYGWQRAFVEIEGDVICRACAPKHAHEILTSFENEETKALTADLGIDPAIYGYTKLPQEFENGLHGGQDADPKKIAKALRSRDVSRFLFRIEDVGQFDMKFAVYIHQDEADKIAELPEEETKADLDPAEGLKRALQSAPIPTGEGITYIKCDPSTGTSTSRKVSPKEFREGIKD